MLFFLYYSITKGKEKQQPRYCTSLQTEELGAINTYLIRCGLHISPEQTVSIGYQYKEYYSVKCKRIKARNSFTVKFSSSATGPVLYGQIQFFVFVHGLDLALIRTLIPVFGSSRDTFQLVHSALDQVQHSPIICVKIGNLVCVETTSLLGKCVFASLDRDMYIMNFPNKLCHD